MNTQSILPPVVESTRQFCRTVIQSAVDFLPSHDTSEWVLLECFRRSILRACDVLEFGEEWSTILDNAEKRWLGGESSADIAKAMGFPEDVIIQAIDNRKRIVQMLTDKLNTLPCKHEEV